MRPILPLVLVVLVGFASSPASAGSAAEPEAPDPPGDVPPGFDFADFLGAWATSDNGTLALGAQLASYTQAIPGACWVFEFAYNTVPHIATVQGSQGGHTGSVSARGSTNATAPVVTFGTPAEIKLPIPTTMVSAKPGDLLEFTDIRSCYATTNEGGVGGSEIPGAEEIPGIPADTSRIDSAEANRPFSVPYPKPAPLPKETPKTETKTQPASNVTTSKTSETKTSTTTTTNSTKNVTSGTPLDPAATDATDDAVAPPEDRGFLGLPGPAPILAAIAALGAALLARRHS